MNAALQRAADKKTRLRAAFVRAGGRVRGGGAAGMQAARDYSALSLMAVRAGAVPSRAVPAAGAAVGLQNKTCQVQYDAVTKVTVVTAGAWVCMPIVELAEVIDPRSWGRGHGVIGKAYRVCESADGEYVPWDGPEPLGHTWRGSGLLYEYARAEIASFENILEITCFEVEPDAAHPTSIRVAYRLHDCLKCSFGLAEAPGGLNQNAGSVLAEPMDDGWTRITVVKQIKVRDLTPNDPGDGYDFGQWVNATIGAALSLWIDDTSMMSPLT